MTSSRFRTAGKEATSRQDLYATITNRIIADLEKGVRPWFRPWSSDNTEGRIVRPTRVTGEPYKGINVLWLWGEALHKGYQSPTWMTYRQSQELGGQVRKGEHGSMSVYADRFRKTETNEKGEEIERDIPFLKSGSVAEFGGWPGGGIIGAGLIGCNRNLPIVGRRSQETIVLRVSDYTGITPDCLPAGPQVWPGNGGFPRLLPFRRIHRNYTGFGTPKAAFRGPPVGSVAEFWGGPGSSIIGRPDGLRGGGRAGASVQGPAVHGRGDPLVWAVRWYTQVR